MSADLAESAFIGSLMHLPTARVAEVAALVRTSDLEDPRHRVIFETIVELACRGVAPDPARVFALARTSGRVTTSQCSPVSGVIVDLYTQVPIPAAAEHYARSVVEASMRRRVIETCTRLAQAAEGSNLDTLCQLIATESEALATDVNRLAVSPLEGAL